MSTPALPHPPMSSGEGAIVAAARRQHRGGQRTAAPVAGMAEMYALPRWVPESPAVESFVRHCHTRKCAGFQAGDCRLHKPMQCFDYHFEGQRRRPAIGLDGRLQYWDTPCEWLSHPTRCPKGDSCRMAHSKDEISYHPAKFKTRVCNGKDCRKAICCFAHCEGELRSSAPHLYSRVALEVAAGVPATVHTPLAASGPEIGAVDLDAFKVFPCRGGRGPTHDRKLCVFYHNARDRRRLPGNYIAEPCSECFDAELAKAGKCSKGDACPRCHNRLELLYHPDVFKQRFCATFPNVATCQRGARCAFAHSRDEVRAKLLPEQGEHEEYHGDAAELYMHLFKTLWCPYGAQHDWHRCMYAHSYQDWRRRPELGYESEPCPYWAKNSAQIGYDDRCPNSFSCRLAHGSKEQLYHPQHYKTMPCTDWTAHRRCPRGALCAFYHCPTEKRPVPPRTTARKTMNANVTQMLDSLQPGFRRPPLFGVEGTDLQESTGSRTRLASGASFDTAATSIASPSMMAQGSCGSAEASHCSLTSAKTSFGSLASLSTGSTSPLAAPVLPSVTLPHEISGDVKLPPAVANADLASATLETLQMQGSLFAFSLLFGGAGGAGSDGSRTGLVDSLPRSGGTSLHALAMPQASVGMGCSRYGDSSGAEPMRVGTMSLGSPAYIQPSSTICSPAYIEASSSAPSFEDFGTFPNAPAVPLAEGAQESDWSGDISALL
mmetsp:Transcript_144736/g.360840  ORF Transcript_144736/g.360840 Transcript_144736/m.360840 type:complete len:717 (+) Transcript_144736:72-2222(+)